jgi:Nif-specific regulatory protein
MMSDALHRIFYVDASGQERSVPIVGCLKVGRSPDVDLFFDEEGVSRLHCQFQQQTDCTEVQDLGSTNGTFVNGTRIREARLQEGDTVVVGRVLLTLCATDQQTDALSKTQYIGTESVELAIDPAQDQYPPATLAPESSRRHLESLYGILNTIGEAQTMEDMLRGTLETILRTLELDFGHVLLGPDPRHLQPLASLTKDDSKAPPFSRTVVRRVLRESQAVLANDIQAEPDFAASKSIAAAGALRIACAPIPLRGQVGALYVASRGLERHIDPEDISFLSAAARQIGLAAQALSERESLARENELLRKTAPSFELIGQSEAMQRLRETVTRAAAAEYATVLIVGESGTGKELVARGIHTASSRSEEAFVAVNCGALPPAVVQSELFGHEKGAFTGAETRRLGLVELACNGTLFLDEIGELPLEVQVMLLRLLEEKRFFRVGGQQEVYADVRFLAATHRDLEMMSQEGRFRADLLYRLKVVEIRTPALRDHPEDLEEMSHYLLADIARSTGRATRPLSGAARATLAQHRWPGNVRELRNVLERALILAQEEEIDVSDLGLQPVKSGPPQTEVPRLISLSDLEKEHILRVLNATGWNKTRAAEVLGVARITLYEKIKNYQLKPTT